MPLVWLLVLLCVLCILGCIAKLLARSIHRAHIYIHKCVQANAPPILTKAGINRNVNVRTFVLSCGIYR